MSFDVQDFHHDVIQRSAAVPVLVDFWAAWCAPCRILGPVLERQEQQSRGSWILAKVDTELLTDVAEAYGIRSIPDVRLFVDGKVVAEFSGSLPEYAVSKWLKEHLPGKHRGAIERASQFLQQERNGDARELLDRVLEDDPEDEDARVLLSRLELFDNPSGAAGLIARVEHPKHAESVDAIRTLAELLDLADHPEKLPDGRMKAEYRQALAAVRHRQFDRALERFIDVIRSDRYYHDDGGRKACIAIFKFLGEDHPVTQHYRREFGGALYV